jgi:UDP-glucuronate decarboxylase
MRRRSVEIVKGAEELKESNQTHQPVITLAKEKLRWAPRILLEEGLSKTITYFDELLRRG